MALLLSEESHALAASRNGQQLLVERPIPVPGKAQFLKGLIKSWSMALHLRIGQRSVHIPEQGLQAGHQRCCDVMVLIEPDPQCNDPRAAFVSTAAQPQLWQLPLATDATPLQTLPLPLPLRAVLMRRGINDLDQAKQWLTPSALPPADEHFPGLQPAVTRLIAACQSCETLAICGDYDADGMTSTALLIRALQPLGACPVAAIPSRMDDGYGLNVRMVEELHQQGALTGHSRQRGRSRSGPGAGQGSGRGGDHHGSPHHSGSSPQALALLHPATTPVDSPYRGLAGVGLAYVLARSLAEALEKPEAIASARDLFCIGTIADMAPLTGANRAWLREGLDHLHRTRCAGLRPCNN